MHPRADAVGVPLSRLASQAAISLFPCCNSAGSSAILRPSVRTHAISGTMEDVTHPDSRANMARKHGTESHCAVGINLLRSITARLFCLTTTTMLGFKHIASVHRASWRAAPEVLSEVVQCKAHL